MSSTFIVYSPKSTIYASLNHPESPIRVELPAEHLKKKGFKFVEPQPAVDEDILLVHTRGHLGKIKQGVFFDPDTPNLPHIYEFAVLAAGGAIHASR